MNTPCDLCGATCEEKHRLLGAYRTLGVTHLCRRCAAWATSKEGSMYLEIPQRMREAVGKRWGFFHDTDEPVPGFHPNWRIRMKLFKLRWFW